jgi:general secretion pathway protein B
MSTILDALKKSERERTVLRGLGFSDAGWHPTRDIDWLRWAVVGILGAMTLVGVSVYFFRTPFIPAEPESTVPVAEKKTSAPATVAPGNDSQPPHATAIAKEPAAPAPSAPPLVQATAESLPPVVPLSAANANANAEAEFLGAMPPEFRQSVPAMRVNIHVYAPEESSRILYINNKPYHRGDEIPGGVKVEEIVPEGVVLQFQGQRFKLARPS